MTSPTETRNGWHTGWLGSAICGVALVMLYCATAIWAAGAEDQVSPDEFIKAIFGRELLPNGEMPGQYIIRTRDKAVLEAIASAYAAATRADVPPAELKALHQQRQLLMVVLARAGEMDLLKKLVVTDKVDSQDVIDSISYANANSPGLPYLHYVESIEKNRLPSALEKLTPAERAKWKNQLSQWRKLHITYAASEAAARDNPDDISRRLVASLVRNDRSFNGLPIHVWIQRKGLTPAMKTALLRECQQLQRQNMPIGPVLKALIAGEAKAELVTILTDPQCNRRVVRGGLQLLSRCCASPFTVSTFEALREGLPKTEDLVREDLRAKATTFARTSKEALGKWKRARDKLHATPNDAGAMYVQAEWFIKMAEEAEGFDDKALAQASRNTAVRLLDFILAYGNRDALMLRARTNEALGNYEAAIQDVDRLIAGIPEAQVQYRQDFRNWRARLVAKARTAAADR